MSGFKLIAIRTGEKPNSQINSSQKEIQLDFFKVLKQNTIYKFCNEYDLLNEYGDAAEGTNEIKEIKYTNSIPCNLHNIKGIDINVSAIVGKNGSGKSSLIELFFASIYLLSLNEKLLNYNEESLEKREKELSLKKKEFEIKKKYFDGRIKEIDSNLEYIDFLLKKLELDEINYYPRIKILHDKLKQYKLETDHFIPTETIFDKSERRIKRLKKEIEIIISNVNVELYYELNNTCYCLKIGKKKNKDEFIDLFVIKTNFKEQKQSIQSKKELLNNQANEKSISLSKHFFYSIAISYSHHGLNTSIDGKWLNDLFHKNDGYQTPLVINPMRTDGNIDINIENELVNQRLLSNLLEKTNKSDKNTLRHLAPNKKATTLYLKFNEDKFAKYKERNNLKTITNIDSCVNKIYKKYTDINLNIPTEPTLLGTSYYLNNKLIKICSTYSQYKSFVKGKEIINIDKLVDKIIEDESHITFKFKQAMNFMRHQLIHAGEPYKEFQVDIDKLSNNISDIINKEKIKGNKRLTIEFLPPPTFDIRIQLEDGSFFEKMSSGEKQKIHSMSSIVYHLINLNSTFKAKNISSRNELHKYSNVNIIFDEVEQYFHPDLQRTFIYDLLKYIEKINRQNISNIKALNIIFATHSSSILSDIPKKNILFLDNGENFNNLKTNINSNTFAGNVHELLSNSFFMNSTIGEFAKEKINEFVKILNLVIIERKKEALDRKKITEALEKIETIGGEKFIRLIGDSIVRDKLLQLYFLVTEKNDKEAMKKYYNSKLEDLN